MSYKKYSYMFKKTQKQLLVMQFLSTFATEIFNQGCRQCR